MKKTAIILGVIIGVIIIVLLSLNINRYSLKGIITNKGKDNIIAIKDVMGEVWEYKDTNNDYTINDNVIITWNDKGTAIKQDDEIIKLEIINP